MQTFTLAKERAVIDVETTELKAGEIPRTKFWGYADKRGYKKFKTSLQLWNFLRKERPKFLLHHSNFDVIQLLVDGLGREVAIQRSHSGRLIRCALGHHTLQNTLTAFPVSLKKIFHAFGYEKTELSQLEKRNYEDCVNGLDCFEKLDATFVDLIGVSPLATGTVAGTTFKAAEKEVGTMPKELRFLKAYRGGRVELYDLNEHTASKLDIHSSYPRSFLEAHREDELWRVRVKTREWYAPLFDGRNEEMLCFPNGTFTSYVFKSNWERYIEPYAEKTQIRVERKWKINFDWICNLAGLVSKIYALKSETKSDGIAMACKFLLNAFYGRIGLKPETERARILDFKPDGDDVTIYQLGRKVFVVFDRLERETRSNYAFAAFITDNARARLFKAWKLNGALYGDTDSIFTKLQKRDFSEPISPACGDWGYEGRKRFRGTNVKDYEWNGEQVVKGGEPGKEFLTWTLKTFAKGGSVTAITRERRQTLRKRVVLPCGETAPIVVNN